MEDPKYGGKRSNRNAIFNEDDDQEISEDENDLDEEIEDDEEIDSEAGDAEDQQSSDDDQVDGEESEDGVSEQFDSEGEDDELAHPIENDAEVQEELKRLREEEKKMLSNMSKSAKSDVEKGQHVKQQLNLWDGFLDTRIRMQKAMNITNQLPQVNRKPCGHLQVTTPTNTHLFQM
jgi:protein AATF/BFR2